MPNEELLVTADTVLACDGSEPLQNGAVLVTGSTIDRVGPIEEFDTQSVDREINVGDGTVLPGLVDAHVHLGFTDESDDSGLRFYNPKNSVPFNAIKAARNATAYLDNGITSLRDVGSREYIACAVRDAVLDGVVPGPRIKASGPVLCTTGGSVDVYPSWLGAETGYIDRVNGVDDVRRATRNQIRNRVDNVKLEASGEWISPYSSTTTPTMSEEEMATAVEIAHDFDITTAVHCRSNEGMKRAISAGIDTIEHGTYLDEEIIEDMKSSGTALTSTLTLFKRFIEVHVDDMPAERAEQIRAEYETHVENLERAYDNGVTILAGTDPVPSMIDHGSTATEIANYVEIAGFDPYDALQCGTINSAEAIGLGQEAGSLTPKKNADIIAVDGDPLSDPRSLCEADAISLILKGGSVYKDTVSS